MNTHNASQRTSCVGMLASLSCRALRSRTKPSRIKVTKYQPFYIFRRAGCASHRLVVQPPSFHFPPPHSPCFQTVPCVRDPIRTPGTAGPSGAHLPQSNHRTSSQCRARLHPMLTIFTTLLCNFNFLRGAILLPGQPTLFTWPVLTTEGQRHAIVA